MGLCPVNKPKGPPSSSFCLLNALKSFTHRFQQTVRKTNRFDAWNVHLGQSRQGEGWHTELQFFTEVRGTPGEESSWERGFPTSLEHLTEQNQWGAADCPNILWTHAVPALRFDLFVSVTRWEQKWHSHGAAEGSTDLEKPGRKATKGTKSAVHFMCSISSLTCMLFFHWALKGAKISFFTNSQTVIKSRKQKLFIKQALGSLSYPILFFSLVLNN